MFEPPRFTWPGQQQRENADAAAAFLASHPKPIGLHAALNPDGASVHLTFIDAASHTGRTAVDIGPVWPPAPCILCRELLHADSAPALIVAGGRALRVSRPVLERLCEDYTMMTSAATATSGPPDDAYVQQMRLPARWLEEVAVVCLLGRREHGRSVLPLRGARGWLEDELADV